MGVGVDAWGMLRYLEGSGPAGSEVAVLIRYEEPVVSWINLGEVFYVVRRRAGEAEATTALRDLRHVVRADLPTPDRVLEAARIKADHPMAYADAFAAATAASAGAVLWTGHPEILVEGAPWTIDTVVRGASERLPSILMTALVTALAMLPIAFDADNPGHEIMGPMAAIIIGGLASSTLLNLLVLPLIMQLFGSFEAERREAEALSAGQTAYEG